MSIDLHCHSYISDGELSPSDVVQLAHDNGCQMLSLTDHDHLGGLAEAHEKARELGMTLINGVEASVTWRGKVVHIVGLNVDTNNEVLQSNLANVRSGRIERLAAISEKLKKQGIDGVYEGALAKSTNPEMVGRAHIARFLLEEGHVRNMQQAFKKYLGEGKSGYVKHEWAALEDVVSWINGAGGVAVIAHPARYTMSATQMRELIQEFKDMGGKGIEVASGSHSVNEILNYALLAQRFEMHASIGSDFHKIGEGCSLGKPPALPPICQPIWQLWEDATQQGKQQ